MTVEAAAAMGFRRQEAETALAMLDLMQAPEGSFDVAMDLARFVKVPLVEATYALFMPRRLRRLGLPIPAGLPVADAIAVVRPIVAGQAEAYTHTWYGSGDVREATGRTLGHAFEAGLRRAAERVFGPRPDR